MAGNCPRCNGVLNRQWNVDLRIWEAHCLTCGNLPGGRLRRGDGRALGAPRYCERCNLRPVARINSSAYTRGMGETESVYCAGCREQVNRAARLKERWQRQQAATRTRLRKVG